MDQVLTYSQALSVPSRLQVLRVVGAAGKAVRLGQVASTVGLARSTAHRPLQVLGDAGLVVRVGWGRDKLAPRRVYLGVEEARV